MNNYAKHQDNNVSNANTGKEIEISNKQTGILRAAKYNN